MEYEFKNKEMVTNKKESRNFIIKKWLEFKAKSKKIDEKIELSKEIKDIKIEPKTPEIIEKEQETKENI